MDERAPREPPQSWEHLAQSAALEQFPRTYGLDRLARREDERVDAELAEAEAQRRRVRDPREVARELAPLVAETDNAVQREVIAWLAGMRWGGDLDRVRKANQGHATQSRQRVEPTIFAKQAAQPTKLLLEDVTGFTVGALATVDVGKRQELAEVLAVDLDASVVRLQLKKSHGLTGPYPVTVGAFRARFGSVAEALWFALYQDRALGCGTGVSFQIAESTGHANPLKVGHAYPAAKQSSSGSSGVSKGQTEIEVESAIRTAILRSGVTYDDLQLLLDADVGRWVHKRSKPDGDRRVGAPYREVERVTLGDLAEELDARAARLVEPPFALPEPTDPKALGARASEARKAIEAELALRGLVPARGRWPEKVSRELAPRGQRVAWDDYRDAA